MQIISLLSDQRTVITAITCEALQPLFGFISGICACSNVSRDRRIESRLIRIDSAGNVFCREFTTEATFSDSLIFGHSKRSVK
jgi:hypothetical protein